MPIGTARVGVALPVAALVLFGASCASAPQTPFDRAADDVGVFLQVDNRNFADHTIHVERGGLRARLGIVTPHQSRRFRIPDDLVGRGSSIRFLADPVGSDRVYGSQQVVVAPGETWRWTLMPNIEQSALIRGN